MRRFQGMAVLAMGAALIPAAYCRAQTPATDSQSKPQVGAVAPGDEPTDAQLARLIEAMRMREQMAGMMKQFTGIIQQQITEQVKESQAALPSGQALTSKQQEEMTALINEYMEKAMNLYRVDEMIQDLSAIYKRHLSREDVDGMIAFYSSPAGQHMIDILPVIMREYTPLAMNRVQERMAALTQEMQAAIKKLAGEQAAPQKK